MHLVSGYVVLLGVCVVLLGCGSSSNSLLPSAAHNAAVGIATQHSGVEATVVAVVDGDTVDVRLAGRTERVRLIGIDTPEATGGILPVECYGDEASLFTKSLLAVGAQVLLTRDSEPRDRYDRLLAYVHRLKDGLFVNLEIVAQGYAEALIIAPNTIYANHFYAAAQQAREAGLGLWKECGSADVSLS